MPAKNVTIIPATVSKYSMAPIDKPHKKRVAGYARVSTDHDEQFTSYKAQIDYYTKFIQSHDDWEFVGVYTDEGISATNTKHRDGFRKMVNDALAGQIDLIVTKSVSRFARNTVDSLTTVRDLKAKGVEVYFEKENIYTLDSKGELLITIMSSLAQEESRSISENVTWGHRKRFADGKIMLAYSNFLGYEKGPDGLQIVESEARIVRDIYDMYLSGKPLHVIAKDLTSRGIPTPKKKKVWQSSTVQSILSNEKYKGSALLQKKFTTDFLTKKQKINEGEVPQYYVEESHPAIIDPQTWALVQIEMKRRKALGPHYSGNSIFSSRLVCGECGGIYGSKLWHSTSKYRRTVWQCNRKYGDDQHCVTPHLTEDLIKTKFIQAINEIIHDRDEALARCQELYRQLTDTSTIDAELNARLNRCEVLSGLNKKLVAENASLAKNQKDFQARYNSYLEQYEIESAGVEELKSLKSANADKAEALSAFMFELKEREYFIEEFDDRLWLATVDHVTVMTDGTLVFSFLCGEEVSK